MAQGINVSCTYLQNEKGVTVSADHAKTIRDVMLSSFQQLDSQGLAPASISQASLNVLNWLYHTLRKNCPKLRLCVDNWKSKKLMTDNYSQWYGYHIKSKKKKLVKCKVFRVTSSFKPNSKRAAPLDTTDDAAPTSKKQCIEDLDTNDTQHNSDHSLPLMLLSPTTTTTTTPSVSPATCDTQELKADESASVSSLQPDKGKQREIPSNVEVRSPLDGLTIMPIATSSSTASATTHPSKPSSSGTGSLLLTTTVPPPTSLLAPAFSATTDATLLALKVELMATDPRKFKPSKK
ncbi:hypothetical protein DFH29DRAFT_1006321 [Suillus ampliporus]|nr:hypothetical protein DFH29DRAFT_1006321 [Suillus ampliporus]